MDRQFYWIAEQAASSTFPPTNTAVTEPNGLLAAGGDLTTETLVEAYRSGVFPWYSEGQPILWWTPTPRCVLFVDDFVVSRSLRKSIKNRGYRVTMDTNFNAVIRACGAPRTDQDGTWILPEMREAYSALHRVGFAHSVETWHDDQLVGGLYGISIGKMFFGESMFSMKTDASKVAFSYLVYQLIEWGYEMIDCQVETDHLVSLGATLISREEFESKLSTLVNKSNLHQLWHLDLSKDDLLSML